MENEARVSVTKWCCVDCGGHRVEVLDWVGANSDNLVGGDGPSDYFCPGCDEHPSRIEEREVSFVVCDTCEAHAWGSPIPLPGVLESAEGHIERCDDCAIYESDHDAAVALAAEATKRDPDGTFRVRYFVEL